MKDRNHHSRCFHSLAVSLLLCLVLYVRMITLKISAPQSLAQGDHTHFHVSQALQQINQLHESSENHEKHEQFEALEAMMLNRSLSNPMYPFGDREMRSRVADKLILENTGQVKNGSTAPELWHLANLLLQVETEHLPVRLEESEVVFFVHVRKSGGSSFIQYLFKQSTGILDRLGLKDNAELKKARQLDLKSISKTVLTTEAVVVHSEKRSFPCACLGSTRANRTLFVTVVREPVERWQSEYNYLNIWGIFIRNLLPRTAGKGTEKQERMQQDMMKIVRRHFPAFLTDLLTNASLSRTEKIDMIQSNDELLGAHLRWWVHQRTTWHHHQAIGEYVPDLSTRFLTGACACLDLVAELIPLYRHRKTGATLYHTINGCPEGPRSLLNLSATHLELAKRVVGQFDVVLPFEYISNKDLIIDLLNGAASRKKLKTRFSHFEIPPMEKKKQRQGQRNFVNFSAFPQVLEHIKQTNTLDSELHSYVLTNFRRSMENRAYPLYS